MKERFYYSVASGSTGNCGLYVSGNDAILIDLGISVRRLKKALGKIGLEINNLSAVLITHEHNDHVKGLQTFFKQFTVPVYATYMTTDQLCLKLPNAHTRITSFHGGASFAVGGMQIDTFLTPHDAAESVGYVLRKNGLAFGFATDLGFMPALVMGKLRGCDTVVLESNHDAHMLQNGPYPWHLKQRVAGNRGHLSNDDCAVCAADLVKSGATTLVLAHLSEQNNTPVTAFRQTRTLLSELGLKCELFVAPKEEMEAPIALSTYYEEDGQVCCL